MPDAIHGELMRTIALLEVLETPVDFVGKDRQPVDIIYLVVGPHNNDSNSLKCIASVILTLQQTSICYELRSARSPDAVLHRLQASRRFAA